MEINKIKIPVTGHSPDAVIRHYALYFANRLGASLLGLHAEVSGPSWKPTATGNEGGKPPFHAFISDCRDHGIASETLVAGGSWQSLLNDATSSDLTVLPCGKKCPLPDFRLEELIFASPQPLLLCPDHYIDIESIALAYDGSASAKSALALAVWLSEKAAWPLSVLMVAENQDQGCRWMDEVEVYLDTLPINGTSIILSGAVEQALFGFMKEGSVELLMMGTFGHHAIPAGSIGRRTAYMINKAAFPLLMVS